MKLFIVLALATVAMATPLVQPITMPEAPLPEFEDTPYVPMFEPIALKPLFVPQEIVEALRLAEEQEVPSDAAAVFEGMQQEGDVHVVEHVVYEEDQDVAAEELVAPADEEILADAVNFVDVADNAEEEVAAPAAEEIPADAVNFVDVAENIEYSEVADEEIAAPAAEEIPADAVNFVDEAEEEVVAPAAEEIPADAVNFVDVAENIEYSEVAEEEVAAPAAEEIPADAVNFVDFADEEVNAEEILPEAVHFVDNAEDVPSPAADVAEEGSVVKVVDVAPVADGFPRYPGKIYDNDMLR